MYVERQYVGLETLCRSRGILNKLAFKMYVSGLDWKGNPISTTMLLERGIVLGNIRQMWLNVGT